MSTQIVDRRLPGRIHDGPNVTVAETVCRIIEPSCKLCIADGTETLSWIEWQDDCVCVSKASATNQGAWKAALAILDRRVGGEA